MFVLRHSNLLVHLFYKEANSAVPGPNAVIRIALWATRGLLSI